MAMDNTRQVLGDKPIYADSMQSCVQQADMVIIMTPWPEFKEVQAADLVHNPKRIIVLDCWRLLDEEKITKVADYITLGTGS
jgi:UDP-glucose 6-dehydrogenase